MTYLGTNLSVLTSSMYGPLGVAAVVAWSHLVVNDSSLLMRAETEEGTMPTQANNQGQVVHTTSV